MTRSIRRFTPAGSKSCGRLRGAALLLLLLTVALPPAIADSAKSLYNKGRDAEARQDYESAYDFYSQAWQDKPKELKYRAATSRARFLAAASYVHRGQKLKDEGKLDEALLLFEKAAVVDPSSFIAQQEIKRTKALIEKRKTGGPPPTSSLGKRVEEAGGPIDLAPIAETPITLKLSEDTKVIYETIGKLAGINVLFDPDYTSRRVKIELNGVTLNEALDILALESKTFWRPVTGNTIFVASDTPAKRKELEQSVIKTFYLSNVSLPTELQDMVNAMRTILEVSRIQQLPSQNAIIVRGTPDQVALAEKLVGDIDKAKPEVVVEVAIMQVRRDKLRDLGIAPPGSAAIGLAPNTTTTTTTGTTGTTGTTTSTPTTTPNQISLNSLAHLNATNFVVTIPQAAANFLFNDTTTKILQNPQIRASDGQKASLKIGDRVPIATGSFQPGIGGVGINPLVNTQFQYIDVGVNIDITPRVHAGHEVTLKLMIDVSSVTSHVSIGGIDQPVIGQRKIEHEIRLKEGEVNLLGGILEDDTVKGWSGIPGLGQIPFFRYLFASQHTELHQNEIVFVLIPHVVRSQELTELNARAIDVGTGTAIDLRRASRPRQPASPPNGPTQVPATAPAAAPQQAAAQPAAPQQPTGQAAAPGAAANGQQAPTPSQAPAGPPTPVGLSFDPNAVNPTNGSTFAVNVVLTGGQDIATVPLQITYNPQVMQLVNVSNGGFLSQDGQPVALVHRDDPPSGTLQVSATRPPGTAGVTGSGAVYTLTFLAKAPGTGMITITRPAARNSASQAIPATPAAATVTVK
ncbi:MAG: type II and III secretion system protein [Acidobacteriia bacterium]|nr:type II and III secretion system protein [Terriglobia bacterium]